METGNEGTGKKENTSETELLRLIKEQNERFDALSKELQEVKAAKSTAISEGTLTTLIEKLSERTNYYQGSDEDREIMPPEEDYDKDGVRFCAPLVGYLINDDFRKNRRVKLPYNKKEIFFIHASTRKVGQGKYASTAPYSVYTSHSKEEIKWLRDHTNYRVMFFESSTEAVNQNSIRALKLARIMNVIRDYELPQLVAAATEQGVPYNEDITVLRINTATRMMEAEILAEEKQAEASLAETYKHAQLTGKDDRYVVKKT